MTPNRFFLLKSEVMIRKDTEGQFKTKTKPPPILPQPLCEKWGKRQFGLYQEYFDLSPAQLTLVFDVKFYCLYFQSDLPILYYKKWVETVIQGTVQN